MLLEFDKRTVSCHSIVTMHEVAIYGDMYIAPSDNIMSVCSVSVAATDVLIERSPKGGHIETCWATIDQHLVYGRPVVHIDTQLLRGLNPHLRSRRDKRSKANAADGLRWNVRDWNHSFVQRWPL